MLKFREKGVCLWNTIMNPNLERGIFIYKKEGVYWRGIYSKPYSILNLRSEKVYWEKEILPESEWLVTNTD